MSTGLEGKGREATVKAPYRSEEKQKRFWILTLTHDAPTENISRGVKANL